MEQDAGDGAKLRVSEVETERESDKESVREKGIIKLQMYFHLKGDFLFVRQKCRAELKLTCMHQSHAISFHASAQIWI